MAELEYDGERAWRILRKGLGPPSVMLGYQSATNELMTTLKKERPLSSLINILSIYAAVQKMNNGIGRSGDAGSLAKDFGSIKTILSNDWTDARAGCRQSSGRIFLRFSLVIKHPTRLLYNNHIRPIPSVSRASTA